MTRFPFKKRLRRVADALKERAPAALLLSAAAGKIRSRDSQFPFRQDSDFAYLTGIAEPGISLLVSSELKRPVLFGTPPDPVRALWDGPATPLRRLAEELGAEPIVTKDVRGEIRSKLRGIETLFFQNTPGTTGWEAASELITLPSYRRGNFPLTFEHSDSILSELRMFKDKAEIEAIKAAARVTNAALFGALSLVQPGASEQELAGVIEFYFRSYGAVPAFNSIVAAGPAAATLHYEKLNGKLKKGQLLLFDIGAESEMYAADISRTVPVNGTFDPIQREVYSAVLRAQRAAIKAIRPGVTMAAVHDAAARSITESLIDLKVLKGKSSKLLKKQAYKPFFPHTIGHMLGIDVHDIGRAHPRGSLVLKKGMVLTVEPGLYFSKKNGKIPISGIRIEDDVLVTSRGAEVLSDGFPKDPDAIEALFE